MSGRLIRIRLDEEHFIALVRGRVVEVEVEAGDDLIEIILADVGIARLWHLLREAHERGALLDHLSAGGLTR